MPKKLLNLVVIRQGGKVLLGLKKRGFGVGRWNGFGGKVKEGETMEISAQRETKEEALIDVGPLEETGILEFSWKGKEETVLEMHIFKCEYFSGIPTETEEMKPHWFSVAGIPFKEMWSGDPYWFPLFLADKKFKGKFLFDENDVVLEKELTEIVSL